MAVLQHFRDRHLSSIRAVDNAPRAGPGSAFDTIPNVPAGTHASLLAAIAHGDMAGGPPLPKRRRKSGRDDRGAARQTSRPNRGRRFARPTRTTGVGRRPRSSCKSFSTRPCCTQAALALHWHHQGRSQNTHDARSSTVRQYLYFCEQVDIIAFPVTQYSCVLFVSWASIRVKSDSLRHYISHLRAHSAERDIKMPSNAEMPYLLQTLDGLAKHEALGKANKLRMPLYWSLLVRLLSSARARAGDRKYDRRTLFSMQCPFMKTLVYMLAFCGALHPSENLGSHNVDGFGYAPAAGQACTP